MRNIHVAEGMHLKRAHLAQESELELEQLLVRWLLDRVSSG